ncbi:methyltransferase domain-containing protein [Pelagibacterium flavum]|uniref:Methyltransferase domain-containing protein n=1 Tax=Pelagibacterium flavum TaxID=2984530 RepID=A0ABY6IRR3_9HYPH|nr:class I SAM-dependent methyltransferase [Pelagibacterium sp. YIM 151497]UYQ72129.1 methyltransferase domain-containing protein [Pelagibacterium sp. YIM 151497]
MKPPEPTAPAFGAGHAGTYAACAPRKVPGFDGLHAMTSQLLAERVPQDGKIVVLGAGGGLELKALAERHPGWTFDGVDPSADMLAAARETIGAHAARVHLHHGYIEEAPDGPFEGAVCLLTFHFIPRENRLETLRQIRRRLVPGAPFVLAHISFAQIEPERSQWIARHIAFGGGDPQNQAARASIATSLFILSPQEDEAMLEEAGFTDITLFYAGLSFRGWACYA